MTRYYKVQTTLKSKEVNNMPHNASIYRFYQLSVEPGTKTRQIAREKLNEIPKIVLNIVFYLKNSAFFKCLNTA